MKTVTTRTPTVNACKLCTPLGACLAFSGFKNTVSLIHGSQGCSTYIRRYMISHFKEPVDIASSNFSEETAVFGGFDNLSLAIDNIRRQYDPEIIGIATSCLSETIGDDIPMFLHKYLAGRQQIPALIHVSTPSYNGTHADGFHLAVSAVVRKLARKKKSGRHINLFPGMYSPAELRYLKSIFRDFNLELVLLPDYSETLDGHLWKEYNPLPRGGTSLQQITSSGDAKCSILFHGIHDSACDAGTYLEKNFYVPAFRIRPPYGIKDTDSFFSLLDSLSSLPIPPNYKDERNRLIDAYADGHKYVFNKKAVIYGEEDLVAGIARMVHEMGILPSIIASGGKSGRLKTVLGETLPDEIVRKMTIIDGVDFLKIEEEAVKNGADIMIGNSKGYPIARKLDIPLIRVGFPIHDRIGGQRVQVIGYQGAMQLFDRICNAILEKRQKESPVGYSYY